MTVWPLMFIAFVAFWVEAALGFGATIVTVALGVLFYPLALLLPASVPLNLVLSFTIAWLDRDTIDWGLLRRRIVPWMLLGMPFGYLLFREGTEQLLYVGFGVFVIVVSAIELWRLGQGPRAGRRDPPGLVAQVLLLVAGGVVHGAYATGGPMAVYVAGRLIPDKRVFRSTLCTLWFILNAVLFVSYAVEGYLDAETGKLCLYLLASLVAGILAGQWLHGRINEKFFRVLVFGFLIVAGVVLLTKS